MYVIVICYFQMRLEADSHNWLVSNIPILANESQSDTSIFDITNQVLFGDQKWKTGQPPIYDFPNKSRDFPCLCLIIYWNDIL